jgi:NAD(P)-dependent dehydrogenase (short-subunit alcohol dehydrogenase family)
MAAQHTAIVTGGSRGIGFSIAKALLEAGSRVTITGRDEGRVAEARAALASSGGDRIVGVAVDVRQREAVESLIEDTVRRFGRLDTVINNAGVGAFSNIETMSDADWNAVIDTNVTGPFFVSRAAIPHLRASGGGWIINIASLAGRNYFPGGGAYCASKAALIAFSESLMQEVRHDNIRVSVIMPGSVATEFSGRSSGDDDWKLTGDDIAEVVMDLLRHPGRSLPSRVEIRPSKPKKA